MNKGSRKDAISSAHSLKGASRSIGATALAEACQTIENWGKGEQELENSVLDNFKLLVDEVKLIVRRNLTSQEAA